MFGHTSAQVKICSNIYPTQNDLTLVEMYTAVLYCLDTCLIKNGICTGYFLKHLDIRLFVIHALGVGHSTADDVSTSVSSASVLSTYVQCM